MRKPNKRQSLLSAAVLALVAGGASAPVIMDQFIREKESSGRLELKAYLDGARVWTICDGKTAGVTRLSVMTAEQCEQWRKGEIAQRLAFARSVIKVPMSEPAWAGFGSFCFNVGNAGCSSSTAVRLINQERQGEGCQAMLNWRYITRSMPLAEAQQYAKGASNSLAINRAITEARVNGRKVVGVKVDCSDEQPWCAGVWDRRQAEAELCAL